GMSSSSALVVAIATGLSRVCELDRRSDWRAAIGSREDLANYFSCLETGRTCGPFAGDSGVGTRGGSEDHVAILCARRGVASAYSYMPVTHAADVPVPAGWAVLVATSGVAAEKTGAAQAQ